MPRVARRLRFRLLARATGECGRLARGAAPVWPTFRGPNCSGVAADGHIYVASLPGKLTVIKAGDGQPEILHSRVSITLDLGEQALASLPLTPGEPERLMQIELVYRFWAKGWLSMGQAAQMAKLDRYALGVELAERGIPRQYNAEDLQVDLALLSDLAQALDLGEAEALSLALRAKATLVLVDESAARLSAAQLGLSFAAVLGLLRRARRRAEFPRSRPKSMPCETTTHYPGLLGGGSLTNKTTAGPSPGHASAAVGHSGR